MLCTKTSQTQPKSTQSDDLYFEGEFDGKLGVKATTPDSDSYWDGYQKGLRNHYLAQSKTAKH